MRCYRRLGKGLALGLREVRAKILCVALVTSFFSKPVHAENELPGEGAAGQPSHPAGSAPAPPELENGEVENTRRPRRNSWAVEFALVYRTLGGDDFDDSDVYVYQQPGYSAEAVAIPKLGGGPGFSIGLNYGDYPAKVGAVAAWAGVRYSATWLSVQSAHTAVAPSGGVLHEVEAPVAIGIRVSRRLIPYLEASVSLGFQGISDVHGLVEQDAVAFDSDSTLFLSKSYAVGLGSLFCTTGLFCLDAFAGYRGFFVTNINGGGLDDALGAGGWTFRLGPAILF